MVEIFGIFIDIDLNLMYRVTMLPFVKPPPS
jgi:hypothetical protein